MIYSFTHDSILYLSDLYCSYIYWYKVFRVAELQFFSKRFVACVYDNDLKKHLAINYLICLFSKDYNNGDSKRN